MVEGDKFREYLRNWMCRRLGPDRVNTQVLRDAADRCLDNLGKVMAVGRSG